ncbi:MAG: hypothetical protein Phog2KO_39750 [Phototrophicaceae bacterium]
MVGKIESIVYQPLATDIAHGKFYRVPIDNVNLLAGHGIEGDRKAGRNPKRHLNIMMRETLDELADYGYKTGAGEMGEQLQISGIDIATMPEGTLLQIGESAVIRLNKPRTGCVWLEHVQDRPVNETIGKLGIMASVIESGHISIGDKISLLSVPELDPA